MSTLSLFSSLAFYFAISDANSICFIPMPLPGSTYWIFLMLSGGTIPPNIEFISSMSLINGISINILLKAERISNYFRTYGRDVVPIIHRFLTALGGFFLIRTRSVWRIVFENLEIGYYIY